MQTKNIKLKNIGTAFLSAVKHSNRKANMADLIEKIEIGLEQSKQGQLLDGDEVFDKLENFIK